MDIMLLSVLIGARQGGKEDYKKTGGNGDVGRDGGGDARMGRTGLAASPGEGTFGTGWKAPPYRVPIAG